MKRIFAFILLFVGIIGLSSCKKEEIINIGLNFGTTGGHAEYGKAEREGAKLALKEFNEAGGLGGIKIGAIERNTESDVNKAKQYTAELSEKGVVAIIGPATTGLTAAAVAEASIVKVPVISPSATGDNVLLDSKGNAHPFGFRICYGDLQQGQVMANFAKEQGYSKVGILFDNSTDYGKGLNESFKDQASKIQLAVENVANFLGGENDFNSTVTSVKDKSDLDALFIPGYYSEVSKLIKALRDGGVNLPILGVDGYESPLLLEVAGASALNNVFYSNHYSPLNDDENQKTFMASFKEEYGKEANGFNALGYDAAKLALNAIKKVYDSIKTDELSEKEAVEKITPELVKVELEKTENFVGVTGTITIDEKHNAIKKAHIIELKDGVPFKSTIA